MKKTARGREEGAFLCWILNASGRPILPFFIAFWCRFLRRLVVFDVLLRKLVAAQINADKTYEKTNPSYGNISDAIFLTISTIS